MSNPLATVSGSGSRRARKASTLRVLAASMLAASLVCLAGAARAGSIAGTIKFEPNRPGKPPVRNQGFLPRIENPLRPVKRIEPWPYMVVVLEGGPMSESDQAPPSGTVRWELLGESFAAPLLPVMAGAQVEIKNRGHDTPTLLAPDAPGLVDAVALKPRGVHAFRVDKPLQPVVIRAEGSPHLQGAVVAFPHRYFARVDDRGRFELGEVPPGEWKARIWYRDGWLKGFEQRIEVGAKRATVTLGVSPVLEVAAP